MVWKFLTCFLSFCCAVFPGICIVPLHRVDNRWHLHWPSPHWLSSTSLGFLLHSFPSSSTSSLMLAGALISCKDFLPNLKLNRTDHYARGIWNSKRSVLQIGLKHKFHTVCDNVTFIRVTFPLKDVSASKDSRVKFEVGNSTKVSIIETAASPQTNSPVTEAAPSK